MAHEHEHQHPETPAPAAVPAAPSGSFAPLRLPVFAVLWAATVLGNIGSFMRDVASAWMVTELSTSPTAVALVQTAATLPICWRCRRVCCRTSWTGGAS